MRARARIFSPTCWTAESGLREVLDVAGEEFEGHYQGFETLVYGHGAASPLRCYLSACGRTQPRFGGFRPPLPGILQ